MALSGISFSVRLWCLFSGTWFLQTILLAKASELKTFCFPNYDAETSLFCFEDFDGIYNVCVQTISGDDKLWLSIKSLLGCPAETTSSISFFKNFTSGIANLSQNEMSYCTGTPVNQSFLLPVIQEILNGSGLRSLMPSVTLKATLQNILEKQVKTNTPVGELANISSIIPDITLETILTAPGNYFNNCVQALLSVKNISVSLNTEFTLSCCNETMQNVSWFKNFTQISSGNNTLDLGTAKMDQNGTYFCIGMSASGLLVLTMTQVTITFTDTSTKGPSFTLIIICGVIAVFFLLGFILIMKCAANQANVKSQSRAHMDSNVTSTMEY
ncbi:uncharacterized protein LOC114660398 [Erpetoichthys calabaricus]|uniref:uncharacterized protein LOC114660398 n=1 Tax=Erpetoichthys calabaricus TaxID=27687 RepID=UPI002234790F|nr:uncharacterized protein LOC114660398 [Erpetoichthys calabaricus]